MKYKIAPVKDYYIVSRYSWFDEMFLTMCATSCGEFYDFDSRYSGSKFRTVEHAVKAIKEAIWLVGIRRAHTKRLERIEKERYTIFVPPWPK